MVVKRMVRHQDALDIPKKCILFVRLDYTHTHTHTHLIPASKTFGEPTRARKRMKKRKMEYGSMFIFIQNKAEKHYTLPVSVATVQCEDRLWHTKIQCKGRSIKQQLFGNENRSNENIEPTTMTTTTTRSARKK